MKKNLLMAFMLMLAGNSFAQTATDTLVVTTQPQMHCQNCEKKIKSNIRFVKGNLCGRPESDNSVRWQKGQIQRLC